MSGSDLEFKGSLNHGVANIFLLRAGRGRCCTGKEHSSLPLRLNDYTWTGNGFESLFKSVGYLPEIVNLYDTIDCTKFLPYSRLFKLFFFLCLHLICHFCGLGCTETSSFLVKCFVLCIFVWCFNLVFCLLSALFCREMKHGGSCI